MYGEYLLIDTFNKFALYSAVTCFLYAYAAGVTIRCKLQRAVLFQGYKD